MAKVFYVPKWIMPFGYGLCLYNLIFIRKDSKDKLYVEQHELVHYEQWKEIGFFKFPFYYILELIENGYWNNSFEIEARDIGLKRAVALRKKFAAACCGDND